MSDSKIQSTKTDVLAKPDMRAVLKRTNLSEDVQGFLLPVFEMLSNSIDGIEQRFDKKASEKGKILVKFENLNAPDKIMISVTDNGVGLNDENYRSFCTPFSGYKLHKGGRGFGRFIAFKVFSRLHYSSRFESAATTATKTFRFDIFKEEEITFHDGEPDFSGCGLCVDLNEPLEKWFALIKELSKQDVKGQIGSHFLPYFLYRGLPEISLKFDDEKPENITGYFDDIFVAHDKGQIEVSIDSATHSLKYTLAKISKTRQFKSHCLVFAAADRIVGHPRDLSNKLGAKHFVDDDNSNYIIVAVVRGDAFETRLNDARTSLDLPTKTIEEIVRAVSDKIQDREKQQIEKIKSAQEQKLNLVLDENPILRLGLKGQSLSEYVAKGPNNWGPEDFVKDLALSRYRNTESLLKQIAEATSNPVSHTNKIKDLVNRIDTEKKQALAEYVIHRESIIQLLDAARKSGTSKQRSSEDEVHSLIFRRFSDSVDVEYFQHNLWLIDDALAFLPYVSSDRTMEGGRRKKDDKVPDLLFYNDTMVLGDEDGNTLTIVEFKKPGRNDYSFGAAKSDPVSQVIDTLEKAIAAGGITRTDGSHMSFASVARRSAFIIADLTSTLIQLLKRHDFKATHDPNIWTRYYNNGAIVIQAFGYDTLVSMAKKRNQAFSTVLLGKLS